MKLMKQVGIWRLYEDTNRQGVYHIEAFDKRINGIIVYPFAYPYLDMALLSPTYGEYIIVSQTGSKHISKKAKDVFIQTMLENDKQNLNEQRSREYKENAVYLESIGVIGGKTK